METLSKGVQLAEENYPVDTIFQDYNTLKKNADEFMTCLETNSPSENNWFILPSGAKVKVSNNNIARLSLFGDGDSTHTILALYEPPLETHVIALYLNGKWWTVSNVLKTSNSSRSGLVTEVAKILWQDGEATGFYTVKPKGTLCDSCSSLSYLLPVLDTVFVRTEFRRKGLAFRMLEDFCVSYAKEEFIGISHPVSSSMHQVCRKYLQGQERDRDRLYEVEAPGGWAQRRNVWLSLQLSRYSSLENNLPEAERESIVATDKAEKVKLMRILYIVFFENNFPTIKSPPHPLLCCAPSDRVTRSTPPAMEHCSCNAF
ncbi:protein FAM169B isoform X2 [Conger conger]|uniref:protein FAM169B isoform X2 n=1 Tax=Conger conger TaxID=82655 RepID=UPI002A59C8C4|nr:protein FAM169B isoform X2 [Conger conger]